MLTHRDIALGCIAEGGVCRSLRTGSW